MAYRDERHALEARIEALRAEIGQLLVQLEAGEQQADLHERAALLKRAGDLPPPVEHRRRTLSSSMRVVGAIAGVFVVFGCIVTLGEHKPLGQRVSELVSTCIVAGFAVGIAFVVVRMAHNRVVDVRLDEDGLRVEGDGVDLHLPWQDVERLHFVKQASGNVGSQLVMGALAVRVDGVWTEYRLPRLGPPTLSAIHDWADWVLGVHSAQQG